MKKAVLTFVALTGFAATAARGEVLPFPEVWRQVEAGSAAEKAAGLAADAATEAKNRAERHWLPRLYVDARSYSSNDPANALIGLLAQRSLEQSDFQPSAINHPKSEVYSRAALGIDLPLYEGGAGTAFARSSGASADAKIDETKQVRLDQYAAAGKAYGSLAALTRGLSFLGEVQSSVERLRKRYQLGTKANPVGYSGALGMRALAQRLDALIRQYRARQAAFLGGLTELGVAKTNWSADPMPATDFADRFFPAARAADGEGSYRLSSVHSMAEASEKAVGVEKGKFLPQVGLFAEGYGFDGPRDSATGYSAGFYLRWNLFHPGNYGSVGEAKLKAASAAAFAEAVRQEERAVTGGLRANREALRANIGILGETERVLREQTKVTETLFRNGSINALQLVEVLNRRTDLAVEQIEAELRFLDVAAEAFARGKTELESIVGR